MATTNPRILPVSRPCSRVQPHEFMGVGEAWEVREDICEYSLMRTRAHALAHENAMRCLSQTSPCSQTHPGKALPENEPRARQDRRILLSAFGSAYVCANGDEWRGYPRQFSATIRPGRDLTDSGLTPRGGGQMFERAPGDRRLKTKQSAAKFSETFFLEGGRRFDAGAGESRRLAFVRLAQGWRALPAGACFDAAAPKASPRGAARIEPSRAPERRRAPLAGFSEAKSVRKIAAKFGVGGVSRAPVIALRAFATQTSPIN